MLDNPISKQEIRDTVKGLKNNMALGNDGFTSDFYKAFIPVLAKPLTEVCNNIMLNRIMPPSWSSGLLIPIPKENKDPSQPSSYRPIVLLNQDYKVFTLVLANRLKKIVAYYVKGDQTGFILKRNIADNI